MFKLRSMALRALVIMPTLTLIPADAAGAAVTAAGCSQSAVKSAVDRALTGDTVVIPAGRCAWTAGVTIGNKGLRLQGMTAGTATLVHDAGSTSLFSLTESPESIIEISGLRFVEGSGGENAWQGMFIEVHGIGRPVLIHDNYFETKNGGRRAIRISTNRGLIWNNEFFANGRDGQAIQFLGPSNSWTTSDTIGMRDITGESNVYVEDNRFRFYPTEVMDPDSGSRVVIRHNTFDHAGMASHGADTSEAGTRHWELYDNSFSYIDYGDCDGSKTFGLNWYFYIRGGTGIIAHNQFADIKSCAWGDKPELYMTVQNITRNSGPYPCWTIYPVPRQIGQSHTGTTYFTDPVYIWGNEGNSLVAIGAYSPDECGRGQKIEDYLKAGRDYVLGEKPGYAKFSYPHPLRSAATPPSGKAPMAPANLSVR